MSVSKRFDRDLYNLCDNPAKTRCIEIFKEKGYDCAENHKKTEVDLVIFRNSEIKFFCETEQKLVWKAKEFPYTSINFPARKAKYAKLDKPTVFIMWNKDLTQYLSITGEDLLDSELKMVRNKYVPVGEYFYQVDISKAVFNDIKGVKNVTKS